MFRGAKRGSLRELPVLLISALVLSMVVKTFLIQFFLYPLRFDGEHAQSQ